MSQVEFVETFEELMIPNHLSLLSVARVDPPFQKTVATVALEKLDPYTFSNVCPSGGNSLFAWFLKRCEGYEFQRR